MVNPGLVVSGAIICGFGLLFLNPMFDIPGMASLNGALPVGTSVEWTVVAFMTFLVVFLTGAVMTGKGFLEVSVPQVRTRARDPISEPSNGSEKEEPMIS